MNLKDVRAHFDAGSENLKSAATGLDGLLGNDGLAETSKAPGQGDGTLTKLQYFEIFRAYRLSEHHLLNHRVTWNLAIQGFLFATYSLSLQKLAELQAGERGADIGKAYHVVMQLKLLLIVIPLVGLLLSICVGLAVWGGQIALRRLLTEWENKVEPQCPQPYLPNPAGAGDQLAIRLGFYPPRYIPPVFGVAWVVIEASLILSLWRWH